MNPGITLNPLRPAPLRRPVRPIPHDPTPSRAHCESHRLVDNCPRTRCPEHIPGMPGAPLRTMPLCRRTLVDAAVATGGMEPRAIAWFEGIDVSRVYQLLRSGTAKMRVGMAAEEGLR